MRRTDLVLRAHSQEYEAIFEALSTELSDTLTDDWRRLKQGLILIDHLLDSTPQLM